MCFAVSESKEEYLACDSQGRRAFDMIRYFGLDSSATWEQFQEVWNPYMYGHGWTAELTSNEGDVELKKWYVACPPHLHVHRRLTPIRSGYMSNQLCVHCRISITCYYSRACAISAPLPTV